MSDLSQTAFESFSAGKFEKAIKEYTQLIEEDNTCEEYYANRAESFFNLSKFQECLGDVSYLCTLNPDRRHMDALITGGRAATELEKFEDAYHCYKTGLKIDPGNSDIAINLKKLQKIIVADIEKTSTDEKGYKAVDFCSQDYYPGDDELFKLELEILEKKYKIKSQTFPSKVLDKETQDKAAHAALAGHNNMLAGKLNAAFDNFTFALTIDPNNHILRRLRAEVFYMNQDPVSTLGDLWLIPKSKRTPDTWFLGGKILLELDLLVVAEFWLRKATQCTGGKDDKPKVLFQKARVKRLYGPYTEDFPVKVDFTEYGRAIFAEDDIEAGEIVFSDVPIVFGEVFGEVKNKSNVPFCHHCADSLLTPQDYFKESFSTLSSGLREFVQKFWPTTKPVYCRHCKDVQYCSEKCRDESWEAYHEIICPTRNQRARRLYDLCKNKGCEYDEEGRKNVIWDGHFSPMIMTRIWATIVATAKRLMKASGNTIPTVEHWAKAKSPFRKARSNQIQYIFQLNHLMTSDNKRPKRSSIAHLRTIFKCGKKIKKNMYMFIAYGNASVHKEINALHQVMRETFLDCGDGLTFEITDEDFKGRYYQAVCNLQVFSSPLTPYHKFLLALSETEETDERAFLILKYLKEKPPSTNLCGMFPLHACLNHSCLNNVEVSDGELNGRGGVGVRAKRDIKKGEEIFTTYIDTSMPRKLRRAWLYKSFNFWCQCTRCKFEGDEAGVCTNCGTKAAEDKKFPCCGRCKKTWYCSSSCQKTAWSKGHKTVCNTAHSKTSYS